MIWSVLGFLSGYVAVYSLGLIEALTTPYFEALHGGPRPRGVIAWLQFQNTWQALYLAAGLVGGLLGFVASFARRRDTLDTRAA